MKKYKAWYGLLGAFGGATEFEIVKCENKYQAIDIAYELAKKEYSHYAGSRGIKSWEDILEELNEDEYSDNPLNPSVKEDKELIDTAYDEELFKWLDYRVEEVKESVNMYNYRINVSIENNDADDGLVWEHEMITHSEKYTNEEFNEICTKALKLEKERCKENTLYGIVSRLCTEFGFQTIKSTAYFDFEEEMF